MGMILPLKSKKTQYQILSQDITDDTTMMTTMTTMMTMMMMMMMMMMMTTMMMMMMTTIMMTMMMMMMTTMTTTTMMMMTMIIAIAEGSIGILGNISILRKKKNLNLSCMGKKILLLLKMMS